jgi:mono/diheme cytochrome c family protein
LRDLPRAAGCRRRGPDRTIELKPDAERVAKAIRNGIGQMPAFSTLTEQQIQAISQYVARATGAAK